MLLALTLLSALQIAPTAAPPETWQIRGDVQGNPLNQVCTVTLEGTRLTGSCAAPSGKSYEATGEVKEGKVTLRHGGEYQGQPLTIVYSGTVVAPGEVRGTVEVQPFAVSGSFTATQATPKS